MKVILPTSPGVAEPWLFFEFGIGATHAILSSEKSVSLFPTLSFCKGYAHSSLWTLADLLESKLYSKNLFLLQFIFLPFDNFVSFEGSYKSYPPIPTLAMCTRLAPATRHRVTSTQAKIVE